MGKIINAFEMIHLKLKVGATYCDHYGAKEK
jgi:hypothetical protein